jgi:hypothetical protein
MSDPPDLESKLANFQAVIQLLERERSKLDTALCTLKELADKLRSGDGGYRLLPALSIPDAPPEPKGYTRAGLEQVGIGPAKSSRKASPEKPAFYRCHNCLFWAQQNKEHTCDWGESGSYLTGRCINGLEEVALNFLLGKDGWKRIDAPDTARVVYPREERESVLQEQLGPIQRLGSSISGKTPIIKNPTVVLRKPRQLEIREGSKKHRVYITVKNLLQKNVEMHIDAMLPDIIAEGALNSVREKRVIFANILSQLKAKGKLVSDNRGNWSLPVGEQVK